MAEASLEDIFKWIGLRDELKAGMTKEQRKSWFRRGNIGNDFHHDRSCPTCPLYLPEARRGARCLADRALQLVTKGQWREAKSVCDEILMRLGGGTTNA